MGSPLSPVIVNLFMEDLENGAGEKTRWKPRSHRLQKIPPRRFSPPPSPASFGGEELGHKITKTSGPGKQRPKDIKNPDRTTTKRILREEHQ
ncbi:hypothetical protein ILUMI_24214 [Ignelater luminosus]|uniref:Uncharacterized protein n=1 Tax=Ignelater luminosus TaxID=2038154 RepID=A0A8K0CCE0_IGNLU|nr:hypothetical protein ILUMI_24214 [Ignelater luminosus]